MEKVISVFSVEIDLSFEYLYGIDFYNMLHAKVGFNFTATITKNLL